jgi:hypothetical protein
MTPENKQLATLFYAEDGKQPIDIIVEGETIWATQKAMAELFDIDQSGITRHIQNIIKDGEIDQNSSNMQFLHIDQNSKKPVAYHSLDMVISVGYRVNSQKATKFRIWATKVLRQYITDGYVIDEKRLREDPEKLNQLAAKIRELRASEKNVYASVRECFKLAASDYEPTSQEVKSFYALLQDKFHHAVTKMTSSQLIIDRANHVSENMGLASMKGGIPTLKEAQIGKNYLSESELYRLHLLSEQFLLYAESTALQGKKMTMVQLNKQLDTLLVLNEYPLFSGYEDYLRKDALRHAENEYAMHLEIKKLEMLGLEVDLEYFYEGGYEEYKEETSKMTLRTMNKLLTGVSNNQPPPPKELPYNPWA